jgi:electron transfer flavoprotein beta subunit
MVQPGKKLHVVVCLKSVLDPEAVNSYALWGRLEVDDSGRSFRSSELPRIVNAYDEQALEVALRLRDAGADCRITALTVGLETSLPMLRRAIAMGVDDIALIDDSETAAADGFRTASLIARAITQIGEVDLVIAGRQGSDYDQGTVPPALAEYLEFAFVSMAADAALEGGGLQISRVTPLGRELISVSLPAVVTVTNEVGIPRYPSSRGMMLARQTAPARFSASELAPPATRGIELRTLSVPRVENRCEIIGGDSPEAKAAVRLARLREEGVLRG